MSPSLVTVTGASGHIGQHVVRQLLAQGRRVRAVYLDDEKSLEGLPVERVQADVTNREAVFKALAGSDVVYHLAAVISLDPKDGPRMRRVNIDGVKHVVDACLAHGIRRLVHASSIHAFASSKGVVDESTPFVGESGVPIYDQTKAAATRIVREALDRGLDAVILHPVSVIGPIDRKPSQIGDVLIQLAHGKLPIIVEGGFNWVDVRDVAQAFLAAEERGGKGEHYIVAGKWVSIKELSGTLAQILNVRGPIWTTPMWLARAALPAVAGVSWITGTKTPYSSASLHALRNHREISHDKAIRELGYRPRPFEETMKDTFAWFREHGMIRV